MRNLALSDLPHLPSLSGFACEFTSSDQTTHTVLVSPYGIYVLDTWEDVAPGRLDVQNWTSGQVSILHAQDKLELFKRTLFEIQNVLASASLRIRPVGIVLLPNSVEVPLSGARPYGDVFVSTPNQLPATLLAAPRNTRLPARQVADILPKLSADPVLVTLKDAIDEGFVESTAASTEDDRGNLFERLHALESVSPVFVEREEASRESASDTQKRELSRRVETAWLRAVQAVRTALGPSTTCSPSLIVGDKVAGFINAFHLVADGLMLYVDVSADTPVILLSNEIEFNNPLGAYFDLHRFPLGISDLLDLRTLLALRPEATEFARKRFPVKVRSLSDLDVVSRPFSQLSYLNSDQYVEKAVRYAQKVLQGFHVDSARVVVAPLRKDASEKTYLTHQVILHVEGLSVLYTEGLTPFAAGNARGIDCGYWLTGPVLVLHPGSLLVDQARMQPLTPEEIDILPRLASYEDFVQGASDFEMLPVNASDTLKRFIDARIASTGRPPLRWPGEKRKGFFRRG